MCDEAGAFSTISDGDIDRMLLLARSGGCVDSLPRLPWETGVMACIFGDGALPRPILQQPRAPLPGGPFYNGIRGTTCPSYPCCP